VREGRRAGESWRVIRMVSYRFTGTYHERSKRSIRVGDRESWQSRTLRFTNIEAATADCFHFQYVFIAVGCINLKCEDWPEL
jgi:hypothetical protein